MKFQKHDIFRVSQNGLQGEIVDISFNSIHQENEYIVKWDHHGRYESYPTNECDPVWELVSRTSYIKGNQSIEFTPIEITMSNSVKVECNGYHTWIDVGFHFTKEVCKHCNVEKHGRN